MSPVRLLARPLLASVFVSGGIDMLRHAKALAPAAVPVVDTVADAARPVVDKVADTVSDAAGGVVESAAEVDETAGRVADDALSALRHAAPALDDPEVMTRVNGAVMVGAGLLLAVGKAPRLASVALAATVVPTTLAGHRFWEVDDPDERTAQRVHFMKNVGLLGGLALAAVDTEGRPGLLWRAGQARRSARRQARSARRDAAFARRAAQAEARLAASRVAGSVASHLPG